MWSFLNNILNVFYLRPENKMMYLAQLIFYHGKLILLYE